MCVSLHSVTHCAAIRVNPIHSILVIFSAATHYIDRSVSMYVSMSRFSITLFFEKIKNNFFFDLNFSPCNIRRTSLALRVYLFSILIHVYVTALCNTLRSYSCESDSLDTCYQNFGKCFSLFIVLWFFSRVSIPCQKIGQYLSNLLSNSST